MEFDMKRFLIIFSLMLSVSHAFATTWFIRADGGTRYDSAVPNGQCNGQADAPYPGVGVNQPCAFNDYRFLYDDQANTQRAWVIAGGDTVIIRGGPWRVGHNQGTSPNDVWCNSGTDSSIACFNPPIPSGTPSQHTRILGENYANCSGGNSVDRSKLTQLYGGFGVNTTLSLTGPGAQYVDVQCLELTRHSDCIQHGDPAVPPNCSSNFPLDDYADNGIVTDVNTANVLLQDMWIHGFPNRGIIGPIGGPVKALRVDIDTNGEAGWDFDDGNGTASRPGSSFSFLYSTIEWSGCNQEYPVVHPIPVASCYGQSTAGYGDGIGTPSGECFNVTIDHSIFRYNVQDGEDFGHFSTAGCTLNLTNSTSYANGGAQLKWSQGFTTANVLNNVAIANCTRMTFPISGAPSTLSANLAQGDMCRAGDAVSFDIRENGTVLFANNTLVTYAPVSYDISCSATNNDCSSSVVNFIDNLTLGYSNPALLNQGGQGAPGDFCLPGCNSSIGAIGTFNRQFNSWFGMRNINCNNLAIGEICTDPAFIREPTGQGNSFVQSELDNFNYNPTSGSPASHAGIVYSGELSTDFAGNTRSNPPTMGAVEAGTVVGPNQIP
jgi:hypothetical protein